MFLMGRFELRALLNCRGVTDLVILYLGRHLGLVGPELYTCLALIILITTVATNPLVRRMEHRTAVMSGAADSGETGVMPPEPGPTETRTPSPAAGSAALAGSGSRTHDS